MNPLIKKKVFWIQMKAESPLCLSSGKGEETDADVMCNYEEKPFVPAASLAGAMRAYLKKRKDEPCIMGYSGKDNDGKEDDGRMSAIFLSDMTFDETPMVSVRDGVELDEKKTAVNEGKYDMEIIEAGIGASFYAEITIREWDSETEYEEEFAAIIEGLHNGEIRLGRKKTRGYGRFSVCHVACKEFNKSNYLEYAKLYLNEKTWETENNELDKWLNRSKKESQYLTLEVPLRLKGGISIRQYASKKGEPDFVHIVKRTKAADVTDSSSDGTDSHETEIVETAVIPGSSFAGAIRHRIETMLTELVQKGLDIRVQDLIDGMFGYVKKKEKKAHVSAVVINESEIEGAESLLMTRNGISRFESSARDKTLFTEKMYVGGTLTLKILIKKDDKGSHRWMLGLILMAVEDMRNGFLAVGGATSVGRGLLKADKDKQILLNGEALGSVYDKIGEALRPLTGGMNA